MDAGGRNLVTRLLYARAMRRVAVVAFIGLAVGLGDACGAASSTKDGGVRGAGGTGAIVDGGGVAGGGDDAGAAGNQGGHSGGHGGAGGGRDAATDGPMDG